METASGSGSGGFAGASAGSTTTSLGDFTLRVDRAAQVDVKVGGRSVLAGLPGGPVRAGEAPLVGFAVQDAEWTYETSFGQFKVEDAPRAPWVGAEQADFADGRLDLRDAAGAPLARVVFTAPEPRHLVLTVTALGAPRRFSMGFACEPGERFVGFGSQSWDVDQRGQTVPVWVSEQGIGKDKTDEYVGVWSVVGRRHSAHWAVPWTLSSKNKVIVADSPEFLRFAACSERDDAARVEVQLPATLHVFAGDSPTDATKLATGHFGRPRVPPLFAYAPWNDAVKGPDRVLGLATKLRDKDVPSSVIWTEDFRGGVQEGDAYKLKEEWEVDPGLYPDMKGMTDELHARGFKFLVYFNSFVYRSVAAWGETAPMGWLVKRKDGEPYTFPGAKLTETGLLDLTNPAARGWAKEKMKKAMALGADGWMNDYAEWLPTDAQLFAGDGLSQHNRYPVLWAQTAREAIDEMPDDVDRLFFGRSGWLGTPQLMDVFWAGDQRTSFQEDDGLPTVPVMGINVSVHGAPAYGHDIAGYQSTTNKPSTKELFFRWTELGAFSPVMRTHHGYQAEKQWSWDKDDETIELWRRYAIEHIRLAPYLAALGREAHDVGVPAFRGMFFEFPGEDRAWTVKDQFMLGAALMVAPVLAADATTRTVWLPPGVWHRWSGGGTLTGGITVEVDAPLAEIPVFARAGAIVPRYPARIRTLSLSSSAVPGPKEIGDDRDLVVFLGGSGRFDESAELAYAVDAGPAPPVGPLSLRWNGMPLAACASPATLPCSDGDLARVQGAGALEVETSGGLTATVVVTGGAASRQLQIDLRR